jgi:hypothetical protein
MGTNLINDAVRGDKSVNAPEQVTAKLYDDVFATQKDVGKNAAQDLPLLSEQLRREGVLPSFQITDGNSHASFDYGADGKPTTVHMLDANGNETASGTVLSSKPDGTFEWYPSDWPGAPGETGASLMDNTNGTYASRNDNGQIANIQRGDGTFVEDIDRDTDGTTVTGLSITKDGQLVTRLQIGDNVSSLAVADNAEITAVTADGTDVYKLDGSIVHTAGGA